MIAEALVAVGEEMERRVRALELSAVSQEAALYAIEGGGKRIRSITLLSVLVDAVGSKDLSSLTNSDSIVAACGSIELIHESSLVHDDLPALDNDVLRRGRPTVHRRYSPGVATMVGNILAAAALSAPTLPSAVIAMLSSAFAAVSDGQVRDLTPAPDIETLLATHELKTGTLFGTACALGALMAGFPQIVSSASEFGVQLGVEFQLRNDLADSDDARGGEQASDQRNQRLSQLSRPKLEQALTRQVDLRKRSLALLDEQLKELGRGAHHLSQLSERIEKL